MRLKSDAKFICIHTNVGLWKKVLLHPGETWKIMNCLSGLLIKSWKKCSIKVRIILLQATVYFNVPIVSRLLWLINCQFQEFGCMWTSTAKYKCPFLNQCLIYQSANNFYKRVYLWRSKTFSTSHRKVKEHFLKNKKGTYCFEQWNVVQPTGINTFISI